MSEAAGSERSRRQWHKTQRGAPKVITRARDRSGGERARTVPCRLFSPWCSASSAAPGVSVGSTICTDHRMEEIPRQGRLEGCHRCQCLLQRT